MKTLLKEKHLKEMGDSLADMNLAVYDMLEMMNDTVKKVLDFKKYLSEIEGSTNQHHYKQLHRMANDLQDYICKDCKKFDTVIEYSDLMVSLADDLMKTCSKIK